MYKIGSILFIILLAVLVGNFGWIALLWGTLGFVFGLFASAQMVLPILMGVPIATSHVLKKEMKPTVYLALVRAPIVWFIVLFLVGWFFPKAADWIYNNEPFNLAGNLGFVLILLSPISKKVRADFRNDFNKSWGKYFTDYADFKKLDIDISDKKHNKVVEAAIKVSSNFYMHTTSTMKDDFHFKLAESRYRYLLFSFSAMINTCKDLIVDKDKLINSCLSFLAMFATSRENVKEFFTTTMSSEQAQKDGMIYLTVFFNAWDDYNGEISKGEKDKAKNILSAMILSTETNGQPSGYDLQRVNNLSMVVESFAPSMRGAFSQLINPR